MSTGYCNKRAALGEIGNTLVSQRKEKGEKTTEQSTTKLSSLSALEGTMMSFFDDCQTILKTKRRQVQTLFDKIEQNPNVYLSQNLQNKSRTLNKIKQDLQLQLKTLSQYSFIDKRQFRNQRSTGDIQIKLFSNEMKNLGKQENKFYDLQDIKGLKLSNIILTQLELTEIVKTLPQLQELSLEECAIDDSSAGVIAQNLPNLINLQLQCNLIGENGAMEISRRLKKLQNLNLYLNNIEDSGAKCLLNNLRSLKTLNLDNNEVTPQTLRYVASKLKSHYILLNQSNL